MARRKRYSAEFKRQALSRADEPGVTDALVCQELGVSTRQLRRWRDALEEHGEENAFPGHGKARDQELTRLRRGLAAGEWLIYKRKQTVACLQCRPTSNAPNDLVDLLVKWNFRSG